MAVRKLFEVGSRVRWVGRDGSGTEGVVIARGGRTVRVRWDDGIEASYGDHHEYLVEVG